MILEFRGEIISVEHLTLASQNHEKKSLLSLKIKDIHTGKIEEIEYMTKKYSDLSKSVGKYISIPYSFIVLSGKGIFGISEKFEYSISTDISLG